MTALDVRLATTSADLAAGISVTLAAQQATGFPLDADPDALAGRLTDRQQGAAAVWVAYRDGTPVGHALVAYVGDDHHTWGAVTDPAISAARSQGQLLELGGLAVHPDHHGRGIATVLTLIRLAWAQEHAALPVSCNWDGSPGSAALGRRYGRPVGTHPDGLPITLYHLSATTTPATTPAAASSGRSL